MDGIDMVQEDIENIENRLTVKEQKMATEKLSKLILINSLPTVMGMFISALYNVVDKFWVAKIPGIGHDALGGVGIVSPVMLIILGFSQLVGIGAASAISINLGKRDKDVAEKILGNAFSLSIIFSLFITFFGILFNEEILNFLGAGESTRYYADEYLTIILYGTLFNILSFSMNQPIRAAGNSVRFASSQLLGAVINIILDPILILYFDMGVKGAAIATVFSMFCSTLWIMSYYFSGKNTIFLKKKNLVPMKGIIFTIFSIGISFFLMQTVGSIVWVALNHLLIYYGEIEFGKANGGGFAVGAMTIVMSIFILAIVPIIGINQGTQPVIGFNYGAGDFKRVKGAYIWGVIYSLIICIIGGVVIQIWSVEIVRGFNSDEELVRISSYGMRVVCSVLILIGFEIPSVHLFVAIGKPIMSIFLSMLRQVILLLPAYFILPIIFGFNGIWFAIPFAEIIATIVTVICIIREFKILKESAILCS